MDNCNFIIEQFAPVGRAVVKHYTLGKDPFKTRPWDFGTAQ